MFFPTIHRPLLQFLHLFLPLAIPWQSLSFPSSEHITRNTHFIPTPDSSFVYLQCTSTPIILLFWLINFTKQLKHTCITIDHAVWREKDMRFREGKCQKGGFWWAFVKLGGGAIWLWKGLGVERVVDWGVACREFGNDDM